MNIGILQCDEVEAKLRVEHGTYLEMYIKLLWQGDPNLTFTLYDAQHGKLPEHFDAADAYLITGSRYGVNDGSPWISALEEFIRNLQQVKKKVIGICFGHQLIAKALGGKVIKSPNGWGIGMSENKMIKYKSWMFPPKENLKLIVSHQDQVEKLPVDTEVLATSDFCPFYMLQIGDNFLTVQGHPEFSKNYSKALIELRKNVLGKKISAQGLKSLQQHCDDAVFATWIVNFLHA